MIKIISPKHFLSILVLGLGLLISFSIVVRAQEATNGPTDAGITAQGIVFPISELGNCTDKEACRKYCDDQTHMDSCITFAKVHGLMNEKEVERAEKFRKKLGVGGGPGGCRTPGECETFCRNIDNMNVCIAFAEEQGFSDPHIEEAKRIQKYIQGGGAMPGGCNSKESCEAYCSDFSHAEECFWFAEKAGINQVRGGVGGRFSAQGGSASGGEGGIPPGQFQKLLELIKKGETPGGCTSKDGCETYCQAEGHLEECIAFGEKVGFIEPGQAEKIKQLGGKGPGGCSSPQACKAYCSDQTHQEECFKFAEEHGFIPPEQIKEAKEGFVRLRAGLEQAPPEVVACLKSVLGPSIIEEIQAGKLTPGPEIGERVRECFEKFGRHRDFANPFQNAPPEVLSCLREKLGDSFENVRSGKAMPTPEMADTFRVCFQNTQSFGGSEGGPGGSGPGITGRPMMDRGEFLRSAPPGIVSCLREKIGDQIEKIQSGEIRPGPELEQVMRGCFESFRPQPPAEGREERFPPTIIECVDPAHPEKGFIPCPQPKQEGSVVPPQSGFRSPGGCTGPEECRRYCSDPAHREECRGFAGGGAPGFGGGGGFVPSSTGSVRPGGFFAPGTSPPSFGAPNFPPVVGECLRSNLSSEQLSVLMSGSRSATEVEAIIGKCFNQGAPQITPVEGMPLQPAMPYNPSGNQPILPPLTMPQSEPVPASTSDSSGQGGSLIGTLLAPVMELLRALTR